MKIGSTIRKLRKEKGLKQGEFSLLCNISQTYLSLVENNQKEPTLSTLKLIANTLGVSVPILIFLSIDEDDVPNNKREIFNAIAPSLKSLMKQIYTDDRIGE